MTAMAYTITRRLVMTTEEELAKLKKDYQKLKQKLYGIRQARKRETKKLMFEIDDLAADFNKHIMCIVNKKAEAENERLTTMMHAIRDYLVDENIISIDEWLDAYNYAIDVWHWTYKKGTKNDNKG